MNRKTVVINTLQISYLERQGLRGPLLFIHGNSGGADSFLSQFDSDLFQGYRILSPDLPGHGESAWDDHAETDPRVYTTGYFCDFLTSFLEAVDAPFPLVTGHSLGGHIALHLAERAEVRGLLLLGTIPLENYGDVEKAFLPRKESSVLFTETVPEQAVEGFSEILFSEQQHRTAFLRSFRRTDRRVRGNLGRSLGPGAEFGDVSLLKRLTCPVSFCLGGGDPLMNGPYLGMLLEELNRERDLHFIPRCGHFPQMEQPGLLNRFLREFLEAPGLYGEV